MAMVMAMVVWGCCAVVVLLLLLRGTVTMVMATMVEQLALPLTPPSFFPPTLQGPRARVLSRLYASTPTYPKHPLALGPFPTRPPFSKTSEVTGVGWGVKLRSFGECHPCT